MLRLLIVDDHELFRGETAQTVAPMLRPRRVRLDLQPQFIEDVRMAGGRPHDLIEKCLLPLEQRFPPWNPARGPRIDHRLQGAERPIGQGDESIAH